MSENERTHPSNAWTPQPGPQTMFAQSEADFVVIGGSPGGGKTVVANYGAYSLMNLRGARRVRVTAFRRDEVSLERAGSVWDRAQEMAPAFGGTIRRDEKSIVVEHVEGQIEDQHRFDFRHLHRVGDERSYDGSEQDLIIFEEIQEFEAIQVFYMITRLRSRSGLRPRLRGTCNADPDCEWLVDLLVSGGYVSKETGYAVPAMSGVVRWMARDEATDDLLWYDTRAELLAAHPELGVDDALSFTFILSRISDNPALLRKDPGYRGRLRLQLRKDRTRLIGDGTHDLGGCWFSTENEGDFFDRDAFKIADAPPSPVVRWVRGWDFGSSEPTEREPDPDWTEGALVGLCEGGEIWIADLKSVQLKALAATRFLVETAKKDGPLVEVAIFQDTGAAGKRDAATIAGELERERLTVHIVHSDRRQGDEKGSTDETSVTKKRRPKQRAKSSPAKQALARPWALLASQGRVFVKTGAWIRKLISQAFRFPNAKKDDAIDAVSCAVQKLIDGGLSVADALDQAERGIRREESERAERTGPTRSLYDDIELIDMENLDD